MVFNSAFKGLNRPRDVDLLFRASLRPRLALWLVGRPHQTHMAVTSCAGYVIILLTDPAETYCAGNTHFMQDAGARINVNTIDCNTDRTTGDNEDYTGNPASAGDEDTWSDLSTIERRDSAPFMDGGDAGDKTVRRVTLIFELYVFLLLKLWYMAQIFPIPKDVTRTVTTTMLWFLWQLEVFRFQSPCSKRRHNKVELV